jgi:hypothetical protein
MTSLLSLFVKEARDSLPPIVIKLKIIKKLPEVIKLPLEAELSGFSKHVPA